MVPGHAEQCGEIERNEKDYHGEDDRTLASKVEQSLTI